MLCLNISNIATKGFDYRCIIYDISKFEAIHLSENSALNGRDCILKKSILKIESTTITLTI